MTSSWLFYGLCHSDRLQGQLSIRHLGVALFDEDLNSHVEGLLRHVADGDGAGRRRSCKSNPPRLPAEGFSFRGVVPDPAPC